jgi:hypothetical protein
MDGPKAMCQIRQLTMHTGYFDAKISVPKGLI